MNMICYRCGSEGGGVLLRCGYEGPPPGESNRPIEQVGCRRLICERCVAGYWVPHLELDPAFTPETTVHFTGVQRPLCEECLNKEMV